MLKAATYVRVSTAGQTDEHGGAGMEAQRTANATTVKTHGLQVVKEYEEQGSGAFSDRPGLVELMADAKSGVFEVLVIPALDRLSRDGDEGIAIRAQLDRAGVTVYLPTGPIEATPMAKMVASVLGYIAEDEKLRIRKRTMGGKVARADRDGVLPVGDGPGLYGYDYHPRTRDTDQHRTVNPVEALVVRRIYELAAAGNATTAICRLLNKEGIRAKKGGVWYEKAVRSMLMNPAYKGEAGYGRLQARMTGYKKRAVTQAPADQVIRLGQNHTPAIVLPALWDQAQRSLGVRARPQGNNIYNYSLSGLAHCECGARMSGRVSKQKYHSYRCAHAIPRPYRDTPACDAPQVNLQVLEDTAWRSVLNAFNERRLREGLRQAQAAAQTAVTAPVTNTGATETLRALEAKQRNLLAALEDADVASVRPLTQRLGALSQEIDALRESMAEEVAPKPPSRPVDEESFIEACRALRKAIKNASPAQRREALVALGYRGVVARDGSTLSGSIRIATGPVDPNYSPTNSVTTEQTLGCS